MLSEPGVNKERVLNQGDHSEPASPTHLILHTTFVWNQVCIRADRAQVAIKRGWAYLADGVVHLYG
jgi:hypothetical protein